MPSLLPATERQAVWRRLGICVVIGSALCACEPAEQTPPAHRLATPGLPDIARAQPVALTLEQVSEAFALGSPATALQRETMRAQLAGAVVRWQIRVYDIESAAGGRFRVVSEPPLGGRGPGLSLLHVQALVTPRGEADRRAGGYRKLQLRRNNEVLVQHLPQAGSDRAQARFIVHLAKS